MFATHKDHHGFTKEGRKPAIRNEVLDSWIRSQSYSIDPFGNPLLQLDKPLAVPPRDNYPLSIIRALLDKSFKGTCSSRIAWILCSASGEITDSVSNNQSFKEYLASTGVSSGLNLAEKFSGTNAVSLSMNSASIPSICIGPEHYLKRFHELCGSAAPFYDIDGSLKGYVMITGAVQEVNAVVLRSMILLIIQAVDREMRANRFKELYKGVKKQFTRLFNDDLKPTVILTRTGYIRQANPAAMKFFGINEDNIEEKSLEKLATFNPSLKDTAQSAITCENKEMEINISGRSYKVTYDKIPVFSETDEFLGSIFAFNQKSARNTKQKNTVMTEAKYTFSDIIGKTPAIKMAKELAQKVAETSVNVLLLGPSGTGKEIFAQSIHNASPRKEFPFVAINCAAIPKEIAESELFGYASGAFTGASKGGNIGKLEAADKGTVFLDEIGDMPFELQAKLLRLLEERTITRIGSNREIPVNIRIIAATNKDIPALIERNEFREDLYYRINVSTIKLPTLADGLEDIPDLVHHFIEYFNETMGKKVKDIDAELMQKFKSYSWPGNIRELRNSMEFAIMLNSGEDIIALKDLPGQLRMSLLYRDTPEIIQPAVDPLVQERQGMENSEKALYAKAIRVSDGNLSEAAKILNVGRSTLYRKIKKFGLRV